MEKALRILLIGGPGSGKTTLVQAIEELGYKVHHEISRMVTLKAQEKGIKQLFLTDPLAFSEALLQGRMLQFDEATTGLNFYDRGIPTSQLIINSLETKSRTIMSMPPLTIDTI